MIIHLFYWGKDVEPTSDTGIFISHVISQGWESNLEEKKGAGIEM